MGPNYCIWLKIQFPNSVSIFLTVDVHTDKNRIGGTMVMVLASSVAVRGFEFWSGKTKDYNIGV